MTALVDFIVVAIIAVPLVCLLGRNGRLRETELPWDLVDVAGRQMVVLGGLAGFAVTNIVLLVSLARDRAQTATESFTAVVTMFLVAYFFYVGTAVVMGFMPRDDPLSPVRPRHNASVPHHLPRLVRAWTPHGVV